MMTEYRIATIPGDGIGKEVMPEGLRVLDAAAQRYGFALRYDAFDWSCDYYARHGVMMPADGLAQIRHHDAVYLGAVGFPGVPDHVSLGGLLLEIRRGFQQYANIRPVRLMEGLQSPLRRPKVGDIDMIIVRENTEGEYSSVGGIIGKNTLGETAVQVSSFSRQGVDRILKYAFELAMQRDRRQVTSATKSNGLAITMPYWDARFADMAARYPDIRTDQYHIDILAARFVLSPERFDVVVASNLFGDILSDLGPACTGTIAIAPSANINPEKDYPSMFEPVHGSAPDIYGQNIANPIGHIWAGAMLLEHLGQTEAARAIVRAIEEVLRSGPRTPDLGGRASTTEVGQAIAQTLLAR
ncbi:tartrate dehydrogenase [Castellaniella sp.]|uniref:tartrate dehydrogenase n=1 Tax=Castellaniella sp. TaxID=1955812 RepID=UPI00355D4223